MGRVRELAGAAGRIYLVSLVDNLAMLGGPHYPLAADDQDTVEARDQILTSQINYRQGIADSVKMPSFLEATVELAAAITTPLLLIGGAAGLIALSSNYSAQ